MQDRGELAPKSYTGGRDTGAGEYTGGCVKGGGLVIEGGKGLQVGPHCAWAARGSRASPAAKAIVRIMEALLFRKGMYRSDRPDRDACDTGARFCRVRPRLRFMSAASSRRRAHTRWCGRTV